jgi:hypothetical protein
MKGSETVSPTEFYLNRSSKILRIFPLLIFKYKKAVDFGDFFLNCLYPNLTEKSGMVERLHRLIVERGAKVANTPAQDMEEAYQQVADALPRPKDCCICYLHVSLYLFTNCGHLCVCGPCKAQLLEQRNPPPQHMWGLGQQQPRHVTCPLCRRPHTENQLMRVVYNA